MGTAPIHRTIAAAALCVVALAAVSEAETQGGVVILGGSSEPSGGSTLNHIVISPRAANVRTVCVRTCDGYFFPMSSAPTAVDPARERERCEASCPGTAIDLYFQPFGSDDPADMMSAATGAPYAQLPQANLFRQAGVAQPPGCACNRPFGSQAYTPAALPGPVSAGSFVVVPEPAKARAPVADVAAPPVERPVRDIDPNRKVRVVGPAFLPDPSEAIDLRGPVQTPIR